MCVAHTDNDLRGRVHGTAGEHMAAEHRAVLVGERSVQMTAMGRKRAGKRDDFEASVGKGDASVRPAYRTAARRRIRARE
jgi:hypothetical protein